MQIVRLDYYYLKEVIISLECGIQWLHGNLGHSYMRPKHLCRLREALEANLLLVKVYHMVKNTPKRPESGKTVKIRPQEPRCCRTPRRQTPAYHTSLVSSWDTLGPPNYEFATNCKKSLHN